VNDLSGFSKVIWRDPLKSELYGKSWEELLKEELVLEPVLPSKYLDLINPMFAVVFKAPAGMGKTTSLINWGIKNGFDVYLQECSPDMQKEDFMGSWTIIGNETVFFAGEAPSAFNRAAMYSEEAKRTGKEPRKVLLIFDEINLIQPAVIKAMGSIFDARKYFNVPTGRIEAGDNLYIVGTMNAEEDSAGYILDPAFRSRVLMVTISINEMIKSYKEHGVDYGSTSETWMRDTNGKISLRELEQLAYLTAVKQVKLNDAVDYVIQKFDEEDRKQVSEVWKQLVMKAKVDGGK